MARRSGTPAPGTARINSSRAPSWCNRAAFGVGTVRLPRDVNIRNLYHPFEAFNRGLGPESARPTLYMEAHFDVGDLRLVD